MTEIHTYVCDICGKTFEDESDCLWHERKHDLENIEAQIHMYDWDGRPLHTTLENYEDARYIRWESEDAITSLCRIAEELWGYTNCLWNFADRDSGAVFYDDDRWHSLEDLEEQAANIRAIVGR